MQSSFCSELSSRTSLAYFVPCHQRALPAPASDRPVDGAAVLRPLRRHRLRGGRAVQISRAGGMLPDLRPGRIRAAARLVQPDFPISLLLLDLDDPEAAQVPIRQVGVLARVVHVERDARARVLFPLERVRDLDERILLLAVFVEGRLRGADDGDVLGRDQPLVRVEAHEAEVEVARLLPDRFEPARLSVYRLFGSMVIHSLPLTVVGPLQGKHSLSSSGFTEGAMRRGARRPARVALARRRNARSAAKPKRAAMKLSGTTAAAIQRSLTAFR